MKHIKKFNEVNKNDFFNEIDSILLAKDIRDKELVSFSEREIETIRNSFDNIEHINSGSSLTTINFNNGSVDICKYEDEWFYIVPRSDGRFYKCDGLDGLLEFLKYRFKK